MMADACSLILVPAPMEFKQLTGASFRHFPVLYGRRKGQASFRPVPLPEVCGDPRPALGTPAPRSSKRLRPVLQLAYCAPCILPGQLPSLRAGWPYAHLFPATPVKLVVSQKVAGHSGRSESTLHSNSATPQTEGIPLMVFSP